jgi:hypothetical protein
MFKWLKDICDGFREGWREDREANRLRKEIQLVASIQLREGSVLVFEHPRCLSKVSSERCKELIQGATKATAIILEDGLTLAGVVHPEKQWHVDYTAAETRRLLEEYGDLAPAVAAAKRPLSRSDHQIQFRDSSSELCQ